MEEYNILDVMDILGVKRIDKRVGAGQIAAVCPYCSDARGKFYVNPAKGLFHCWHCGAGGNSLTLYADLTGISGTDRYKRAYREIRERLDLDDPAVRENRTARMEGFTPVTTEKVAPVKVRDATYRAMLSALTLGHTDKADLIFRGLTEPEITSGLFKTVPAAAERSAVCATLAAAGCTLSGVPGFYVGDDGKWQMSASPDCGYFCPAFQDGDIVGLQIRLRHPKDGQKYIWFSSAGKNRGVSSGSPLSSYGDTNAERVLITEGTLKGYVAHCFLPGQAIIALPGVSCSRGLEEILRRHAHKAVYEAFDMDKAENPVCREGSEKKCPQCRAIAHNGGLCEKKTDRSRMLKKSIAKLEQVVKECGYPALNHYYWDRDPDTGYWSGTHKGIDDYLAERRKEAALWK